MALRGWPRLCEGRRGRKEEEGEGEQAPTLDRHRASTSK